LSSDHARENRKGKMAFASSNSFFDFSL